METNTVDDLDRQLIQCLGVDGRASFSALADVLRVTRKSGVIYNLLADRWQLSRDTDVNYMVVAEKPRA